jgi:AraC-like DNA-binding protein
MSTGPDLSSGIGTSLVLFVETDSNLASALSHYIGCHAATYPTLADAFNALHLPSLILILCPCNTAPVLAIELHAAEQSTLIQASSRSAMPSRGVEQGERITICFALLSGAQTLVDRILLGSHVPASPHGALVSRVRGVIARRYRDERLTSRTAANECGVSQAHLCRVLRHHIGSSFRTLLAEERIAAALRLMLTTTLSVKEVAAAVGYTSTKRLDEHFLRCYRDQSQAFAPCLGGCR